MTASTDSISGTPLRSSTPSCLQLNGMMFPPELVELCDGTLPMLKVWSYVSDRQGNGWLLSRGRSHEENLLRGIPGRVVESGLLWFYQGMRRRHAVLKTKTPSSEEHKPHFALRAAFVSFQSLLDCSIFKSSITISSTRASKVYNGDQSNSFLAFEGSPSRMSTSAGRKKRGSDTTNEE